MAKKSMLSVSEAFLVRYKLASIIGYKIEKSLAELRVTIFAG